MKRVVILSPSPYSVYTLAVAELCSRAGIQVEAVCVARLLNFARIRGELRRDGRRVLTKVWRKLILRERDPELEGREGYPLMRAELGLAEQSVGQLSRRIGFKVVHCRSVNDPAVTKCLDSVRPDVVLFTGGGLIRQPVLSRAGLGVINCHMGLLPEYRGMDVVEWAVLEGRPEGLGVTAHLMDAGVDTGPILKLFPITPRPGETFKALRARYHYRMILAMVESCVGLLDGAIVPAPQERAAGRQYFNMHPVVYAEAEVRLAALPGRQSDGMT